MTACLHFAISVDSQVVASVVANRRSSSPSPNAALEKGLGTFVLADVVTGPAWLRSALNPADDPTRAVPLRGPARAMPSWLFDTENEDFVWLH